MGAGAIFDGLISGLNEGIGSLRQQNQRDAEGKTDIHEDLRNTMRGSFHPNHTPESVHESAVSYMGDNAKALKALGHPEAFVVGPTSNASGIGTNPATDRIHLDPEKLARVMGNMPEDQATEWLKRAVAHEVIHLGTLKYAKENPQNQESLMGLTKDTELMKRAADAYGPEWEHQGEFAKAAEAARMLVEGPEKLTEASYKFLQGFLDWLKTKLSSLSPEAKSVVNGIKAKMGEYEAAQETQPNERVNPKLAAQDRIRARLAA